MAPNFPRRTALHPASPLRHRIGPDKIMWGGGHPHDEGAAPCSREGLRIACAGLPSQEVPADATGPAFAPGGSVRVW